MFNLTKEQENRLDYYINDSMEEIWNIVDDAREKADQNVKNKIHNDARVVGPELVKDWLAIKSLDKDDEQIEACISIRVCKEMISHLEEAVQHLEDLL